MEPPARRSPEQQPQFGMDQQPRQRQMGRRSGRFRKQPPDAYRNQPDPSTPRPQHHQSPDQPATAAAATPSQQSMMQDMFVENYRRPSSRLGGEAEEDPDRIEVDGSFNDRNQPLRKSTSSLGRSESYKRSKSIPLRNPDNDDEGEEEEEEPAMASRNASAIHTLC